MVQTVITLSPVHKEQILGSVNEASTTYDYGTNRSVHFNQTHSTSGTQ